jgi:hypothetical protein
LAVSILASQPAPVHSFQCCVALLDHAVLYVCVCAGGVTDVSSSPQAVKPNPIIATMAIISFANAKLHHFLPVFFTHYSFFITSFKIFSTALLEKFRCKRRRHKYLQGKKSPF